MRLFIVRLCFAFYASMGDHVVEPLYEVCFETSAPVPYDVEWCPGEVTTPADDWTHATCELSFDD